MATARALTTNMAAAAAGKMTVAVVGVLTLALLTRGLGPGEFGHYRTVLTFVSFASIAADLGLYVVLLRTLARPDVDASRAIGTALALRLAVTGAVLLAASVVALLLPYDAAVKRGIFVGALIYTAYQSTELLAAVFQRALRQGLPMLAEAAGALAALGLVWLAVRMEAGTDAMLLATFAGSAVTFAGSWAFARRLVPFRLGIDLATWKRFALAGLPVAASNALGIAMLRGDTLLLSLIQPAGAVGLYGVPTKMFELSTTLPVMFAGLMLPLLSAAAADRPRFAATLANALDATVLYGFAGVLVLALFGRELITLVASPSFAAGAPALALLAVASLASALSTVMRYALLALDRAGTLLRIDAVALAVAFAAYLTLIPRWSFVGAAAATLVAETFVAAATALALVRLGRPVAAPRALRTAASALVAGVAALGLESRGLPWGIALAGTAATYVTLLALTGAVPRAFVTQLRRPSPSAIR